MGASLSEIGSESAIERLGLLRGKRGDAESGAFGVEAFTPGVDGLHEGAESSDQIVQLVDVPRTLRCNTSAAQMGVQRGTVNTCKSEDPELHGI